MTKPTIIALLSVLPLVHAFASDGTVTKETTICTTYRLFVFDTQVKLPPEYNQMIEKSLAKMWYRPVACSVAQVRLSIEMRISGTQDSRHVGVSILGQSGARSGKYATEFAGDQFESDHDRMIAALALGFSSVMEQIEPNYAQKLLDYSRQRPQSPR